MKKQSLRRALCVAMATITAICFTACGNANETSAETNAASATTGLAKQGIIEVVDVNPTTGDITSESAAGETVTITTDETTNGSTSDEIAEITTDETTNGSAAGETATITTDETTNGSTSDETTSGSTIDTTTHKYQSTIVDKYPDADYIEAIADGRFIILFRDIHNMKTDGVIYDINTDKELNSFEIYNCHSYRINPVIFYGKGFGFITSYTGNKRGFFAYYYDTEGNQINKFDYEHGGYTNSTAVFAPDGSALYVAVNDRQVCACGYDLKPDYKTQIYKVYPDGTEEQFAEYDSHYIIYPLGVTDEGRLVLMYRYDTLDKKAMGHQDYERLALIANNLSTEGDAIQVEFGYAFMNTDEKADHELDKFYLADGFYQHVYVRGNTITLMDDDEIIYIVPDENGRYKGLRYNLNFRSGSYYTYETSSGRYMVISESSQLRENTTINVMHFENDNVELIFQKTYEGCRIDMDTMYERVVLDEGTGDLFGELDESSEDGARGLLYHDNIFEN